MSRVLVVSLGGGVGDVVLATPVMRALRQRFAQVTVLTRPDQAPVLTSEVADEIWHHSADLWAMLRRIRQARFDAAVVTWATASIAWLLLAARVPIRVGQAGRLYSPLFTHRVIVRSEFGDRTTHWSEILLDYARALGCDGDAQPSAPMQPLAAREAAALLDELALTPKAYLLLHPTRGIATQREGWPSSGLARLATTLREHYGLPVLISGSPADSHVAEGIARRSGARSIAGRVDLPTYTEVARHARLVVAMDSGPMHLAAATGSPTLGLFVMQSDRPDRWHPLGRYTDVVRASYPCPVWHTKERCPDFACVRELPIAEILDRADALLARAEEEATSRELAREREGSPSWPTPD